jgi:DNA polymerase-3 subunit delta
MKMPVIRYPELKKYLNETSGKGFAPIYLIFGEEVLYKKTLNKLVAAILPGDSKNLNYEPVEGADDNIHHLINRLGTYSLLSGPKVVAHCDSQIFYTKEDKNSLLEKAKKAYDNKNLKKSAKYFLSLLSLLKLDYDDLSPSNREKAFNPELALPDENPWIDNLIEYCIANKLSIATPKDNKTILQNAVKKGFPKGNHLIITTEAVNKKTGLFNTIKEVGVIIDCSVPKGNRKDDKAAQAAVINASMRSILNKRGKRIGRDAYNALYDLTGFDLRIFTNNIEKLTDYIGERDEITVNDVKSVLKRSKKDPLYEFTNAITDKDMDQALFFMSALLYGGDIQHPLQLLAAIANQIRKLLMIKSFVRSRGGKAWHSACRYPQFQSAVMPAVIEFDREIAGRIKAWDKMLNAETLPKTKKGKKSKAGTKKNSDKLFLIAQNPRSPYPVYRMLQKSEKFTEIELLAAMRFIHEADLRFKSSGQDPKLILENIILKICRKT